MTRRSHPTPWRRCDTARILCGGRMRSGSARKKTGGLIRHGSELRAGGWISVEVAAWLVTASQLVAGALRFERRAAVRMSPTSLRERIAVAVTPAARRADRVVAIESPPLRLGSSEQSAVNVVRSRLEQIGPAAATEATKEGAHRHPSTALFSSLTSQRILVCSGGSLKRSRLGRVQRSAFVW